ncbi:MAG: dihydroorotate dehydrogenase [Fidelibacterota bacterium]
MADLRVEVSEKLKLKNPLMTASGTFGYGDEVSDFIDTNLYGGIVSKSLSLKPRMGNPPPRITETPSGMINSIGLANIGLEKFLNEKESYFRNFNGKLIVNIAGREDKEYYEILQQLDKVPWVHGFEINVSCPNVKKGGIQFGTNPDFMYKLIEPMRDMTDKFLMIKLSPNVTDIAKMAEKVQQANCDAVSMINTLYGSAIDIYTRKPKINTVIGGLSGPAVKPVAIANIIKANKAIDIPIVGIGGIATGEDVIEFLLAGASAVQLGTVHFYDPTAVAKIHTFLNQYLEEQNISSIKELIGEAKI